MDLALTDSAVDEPAKCASAEFIGRALVFTFLGAMLYGPAVFYRGISCSMSGEQKVDLALDMGRDRAPPLLVAVYRLDGTAQQLGNFLLGFP